ncbi:zymogen granule membrane protein 16-like [Lithobates pipiens]
MWLWILVSVCAITAAQQRRPSHSGEHGSPDGERFSQSANKLDGQITALRVRSNRRYISGIQVRYGAKWSKYRGGKSGDQKEILLNPGEHISQVKGKNTSVIHQLVFITNKGQEFSFGKDIGTAFNSSSPIPDTYLRYISGSSDTGINAISFHWDNPNSNCDHCEE